MSVLPRTGRLFTAITVSGGLFLTGCVLDEPEELIRERWRASPHADSAAWSFRHWTAGADDNERCAFCHTAALDQHQELLDGGPAFAQLDCVGCHDLGEVPSACAKCHATGGYLDFVGHDGSIPGQVDAAAPSGTVIECEVCHNDAASNKTSSVMPSGIEIAGLGMEAACMDCHQGRQSKTGVDEILAGLADDEIAEELRFIDVHNEASGPSQYGTRAKGGYEYDGRIYAGPYDHVTLVETCIACHDPHSTSARGERCSACHLGATDAAGRAAIRVSGTDFDGDRDVTEGLADEISTLRGRLLFAIEVYAARTKGLERIVYGDRSPYFFDEQGRPYSTWTPRLLRAAYNYRYTAAPGGFAHGGKYHIQLLHDSMGDLGADTSAMIRP